MTAEFQGVEDSINFVKRQGLTLAVELKLNLALHKVSQSRWIGYTFA